MLEVLSAAGLDIEDPMQMLMFIKNFNPGLFEETFHPSIRETGKLHTYFPTDMGSLTKNMIDKGMDRVRNAGLEGVLKGKRVLVASADAHVYGLRYVKNMLQCAGAEVVDAGVDASIPYILDMADEEGVSLIGVSTHNGQALGIAEQLLEEIARRDRTCTVFMGGVLNTILPGHSEPSDVKNLINERGLFAENDLLKTIAMLREQ